MDRLVGCIKYGGIVKVDILCYNVDQRQCLHCYILYMYITAGVNQNCLRRLL